MIKKQVERAKLVTYIAGATGIGLGLTATKFLVGVPALAISTWGYIFGIAAFGIWIGMQVGQHMQKGIQNNAKTAALAASQSPGDMHVSVTAGRPDLSGLGKAEADISVGGSTVHINKFIYSLHGDKVSLSFEEVDGEDPDEGVSNYANELSDSLSDAFEGALEGLKNEERLLLDVERAVRTEIEKQVVAKYPC